MADITKDASTEELEFSTFYVGGALCGINILNIQEINKHFEIIHNIIINMIIITIYVTNMLNFIVKRKISTYLNIY